MKACSREIIRCPIVIMYRNILTFASNVNYIGTIGRIFQRENRIHPNIGFTKYGGVDLIMVIDIQLQIIIYIIYFQYLFYNNQNGVHFPADKHTY